MVVSGEFFERFRIINVVYSRIKLRVFYYYHFTIIMMIILFICLFKLNKSHASTNWFFHRQNFIIRSLVDRRPLCPITWVDLSILGDNNECQQRCNKIARTEFPVWMEAKFLANSPNVQSSPEPHYPFGNAFTYKSRLCVGVSTLTTVAFLEIVTWQREDKVSIQYIREIREISQRSIRGKDIC